MSLNRPPLPAAWVERIFTRLAVIYGHAFLGRWSGLDLAAVKESWGEELAGLAGRPDAIAYGLENLPAEAPTVLQFRELCRPALREERQPHVPQLEAPAASPERVAAALARIAPNPERTMLDWAHRLKAREEYEAKNPPDPRHRMTPPQREAWRIALKVGQQAEEVPA